MTAKRHINSDIWDKHLSQPSDGLLGEVLIRYTEEDGKIKKLTVKRTFFRDGTYMDNQTTEVIKP